MKNQFTVKLRQQDLLIGTLITLGHPSVSEILSQVGFDWLFIDLEHTTLDLSTAQSLMQAMSIGCHPVIRVPWNDHVWIKRVLELGPDGIIVPQIKTAEDAQNAVKACQYPPEGIRGAGAGRAQLYGKTFNQYVQSANDNLAIIIQIEHKEAIDNIESILDVSGITAVLIGPYDLSGSLGILGQVEHPLVLQSIHTIKQACQKKQIPLGIFTMDTHNAQKMIQEGFSLIAVGIDMAYMWHNAQNTVNILKPNATMTSSK